MKSYNVTFIVTAKVTANTKDEAQQLAVESVNENVGVSLDNIHEVEEVAGIRKATHRLIDSVWTITFEVIDGKAKILGYNREDKEGYEKERELMQGTVIEDNERTAIKLVLRPYDQFNGSASESNCTESYEVLNPKHIFDY